MSVICQKCEEALKRLSVLISYARMMKRKEQKGGKHLGSSS